MNHDMSALSESDNESDIETDLILKFKELGQLSFDEEDYPKVEAYLRKAVAVTKLSDPSWDETSTPLQAKLAFALCFQEKWDDAESILWVMSDTRKDINILAIHCLHALSIAYLEEKNLEKADRICRRALLWKKKVYKKQHPFYFESLALLARICDAKGDSVESEAWLHLLPPNTSYSPSTALDYLTQHKAGFKDTSGNSQGGITGQQIKGSNDKVIEPQSTANTPETSSEIISPMETAFSSQLNSEPLTRGVQGETDQSQNQEGFKLFSPTGAFRDDSTVFDPKTPTQQFLHRPILNQPSRNVSPRTSEKEAKRRIRVNLDDFNFLAILGKNKFGKTALAESKTSKLLYAVRIHKKEFALEDGHLIGSRTAKNVFMGANKAQHPFVMTLHSTFQTETRFYFVMEYLSGGSLEANLAHGQFGINRAR
jgi:hypothetical protein